jgi:hypothetical protein
MRAMSSCTLCAARASLWAGGLVLGFCLHTMERGLNLCARRTHCNAAAYKTYWPAGAARGSRLPLMHGDRQLGAVWGGGALMSSWQR